MLLLVFILLVALWVVSLYRLTQHTLKPFLLPALVLKLGAGLLLGWVYIQYLAQGKGADTFGLYNDGVWLARLVFQDWESYFDFLFFSDWHKDQDIYQQLAIKNPRGVIFSKWVSVGVLLVGENYWRVAILFSLLSFTGIWWCVNVLYSIFPKAKFSILLAFFAIPSVIFWTSGVIKESLLMALLCTMVALFIRLMQNVRKNTLGIALVLQVASFMLVAYVMLVLKYYYLAAFVAVMLATLAAYFSFSRFSPFITFSAVLILGFFITSFVHPNLNVNFVMEALVRNNQIMVEETTNKENLIHFQNLEPTLVSVFRNVPIALFEGWFRPYIWEEGNTFKKIAALETLLLGVLTLFCLIPPFHFPKEKLPLCLALGALAFSSILLVMLTLAAPNLGNLVRYKAPFLPFILVILFEKIRVKKVLTSES